MAAQFMMQANRWLQCITQHCSAQSLYAQHIPDKTVECRFTWYKYNTSASRQQVGNLCRPIRPFRR